MEAYALFHTLASNLRKAGKAHNVSRHSPVVSNRAASLASQTASSPPFLQTDVIGRGGRVWSGLYRFCSEPPELGGSLICSCRGNNDIHIG